MSNILLRAALGCPAAEVQYIEDVFSTYLYTGNGATQTITTGVDLSANDGMVWIKGRSGATSHQIFDTERGATYELSSDTTGASTEDTDTLTTFLSTGFSLGADANVNTNTATYASWTFREAPGFFDQAQVVKSGGSDATASFTALSTLGMVAVKRTDNTGDWYTWHRSLTAGKLVYLNLTDAEATLGHITVSGTTVTLEDGVIADGTYIVYAWAHDTGADGLIQCGSYTGNGSATGPTVTLGWEPQLVIVKIAVGSNNSWHLRDNMRGAGASNSIGIKPNTSDAEDNSSLPIGFLATGFQPLSSNPTINGDTFNYIYCAIRRGPMKQPTSGTQVFNAATNTGDGSGATGIKVTTGFPPDLALDSDRDGSGYGFWIVDRLRGGTDPLASLNPRMHTWDTSAEVSSNDLGAFDMTGFRIYGHASSWHNISYGFRRYPGVFDTVAYTGTGEAGQTVTHGLGVSPELIITKDRNTALGWGGAVSSSVLASLGGGLGLNSTAASNYNPPSIINETTFSVTNLPAGNLQNVLNTTYVAYLFATKAGISKVGSYTGDGTSDSSKVINCGFSTGARFVMIKRTDETGNWVVFDSARGIVAGNDPYLLLNSTAAEDTDEDAIDTDNSGFKVNQTTDANINIDTATYIYLAFS